ncbi:MFS transporter, partial [Rhodobacter capsulatus]
APASAEEAAAKAAARTPWAAALAAAAILFAAFVAENATETWSALHIERNLGGAPGEGAFGPAMLGLTMAAGRFGGQLLAARLGEARLVALSAVLGCLGALVTAVAPVQAIAVFGIGLIGMGVAVVVPSANSLLGQRVAASERALAISRAWMIGFTGFFIGPVVMGALAQGFGLRAAFVAVALILAAILPGLWALRRIRRA